MAINGKLKDDGSVIFPVEILTPRGESRLVEGLLDTGGCFSQISASLADSLNLKKLRDINIAGSNIMTAQPAYYIFIKLNDIVNTDHAIIVVRCDTLIGNYVLIGRPILKDWDFDYRGFEKKFEIRKTEET